MQPVDIGQGQNRTSDGTLQVVRKQQALPTPAGLVGRGPI
jgi:hypothetical protein